jgi:hypothetical protein
VSNASSLGQTTCAKKSVNEKTGNLTNHLPVFLGMHLAQEMHALPVTRNSEQAMIDTNSLPPRGWIVVAASIGLAHFLRQA